MNEKMFVSTHWLIRNRISAEARLNNWLPFAIKWSTMQDLVHEVKTRFTGTHPQECAIFASLFKEISAKIYVYLTMRAILQNYDMSEWALVQHCDTWNVK
jgi:hypothetical protein